MNFLSFYTEFLPRFRVFFRRSGKKIFENCIFFHRDEKKWIFLPYSEKKWIFLPYWENFSLKLNFKILKVVLEAAEAIEDTM